MSDLERQIIKLRIAEMTLRLAELARRLAAVGELA